MKSRLAYAWVKDAKNTSNRWEELRLFRRIVEKFEKLSKPFEYTVG